MNKTIALNAIRIHMPVSGFKLDEELAKSRPDPEIVKGLLKTTVPSAAATMMVRMACISGNLDDALAMLAVWPDLVTRRVCLGLLDAVDDAFFALCKTGSRKAVEEEISRIVVEDTLRGRIAKAFLAGEAPRSLMLEIARKMK